MTEPTPIDRLPPDAITQVLAARKVLERHLSTTLQAIHVFGSAAEGRLMPRSDIDLMVVVRAPLAEEHRAVLMQDLLAVSAPPGTDGPLRALEVTVLVHEAVRPWRHPARRELQFGEWLRDEIAAGRCEPAREDPDLAILLAQVLARHLCLLGAPAEALFDPVPARDLVRAYLDTIEQWQRPADWAGDEQTVVLALARIHYSASTGKIAAKDTASAWLLPRLPAQHRAVLQIAIASYLGEAPDTLAQHADAVEGYVRCVRGQVRPLLDTALSR